jgi:hypothetical protein
MKTAVEWLMREFQEVGYISLATYEQAKEMEKQHIVNAAKWMPKPFDGMEFIDELGKEYYKQTFKQNEQE